MDVKENLAKIEKEIDASIKKSAHSAQPHVIAVTKYVTIERAREAYKVGIRHFGENRLDGFKEKKESLPSDVKLHFIGSLQSRKVKDIINEEVNQFINQIKEYENIQIIGLMTMAPLTDDLSYIRNLFKELRHKRNEIQQFNLAHAPCTELSMGMSNDYQMAVEEGATFVRIGTKLVGE